MRARPASKPPIACACQPDKVACSAKLDHAARALKE
jgi:hypothetical protein